MRQCFVYFVSAYILCILPVLFFSVRQEFAGANILRFFRLRLIIVVMIMNCVCHDDY
jgi:hypothetical protein